MKMYNQNFQDWFGGMPVKKSPEKLTSFILPKPMTDQELFDEYNPSRVSLGSVLAMMGSDRMLKNGHANIFYVKDKDGVLRAVRVTWDGDGWDVDADSVEDPIRWSVGGRVFSRNSVTLPPEPSDTKSLRTLDPSALELQFEKRIAALEAWKEKVTKALQ